MVEPASLKPAGRAAAPVRGLASLAAALGLGAVTAAAACCVLPLALASIGVGASLAGGFAALANVRTPLLVIGAVALAAAWIMWWRKRGTACASGDTRAAPARSRGSLVLLIVSTVLVGLAALIPEVESTLMVWLS